MVRPEQPRTSEAESRRTTPAVVHGTEVEIRPVLTAAEYRACVELQRLTWGADFSELVPVSMLQISGEVGGITAGGFDAEGDMLGFVFGLTGVEDGRLVHWSHMLAVRPEARNRGLGRRLKRFQAKALRDRGVERIYWTFDPLVARNAHLNLNSLGVQVREYVPDMYGDDTGSDLHSGLGTDRFVVEWPLEPPVREDTGPAVGRAAEAPVGADGEAATEGADPGVARPAASGAAAGVDARSGAAPDPGAVADLPVVNAAAGEDGTPMPAEEPLEEAPAVRIEVPRDIQAVKADSRRLALAWRQVTRRAFGWYLERGYTVDGFQRDDRTHRCFYVVRRPDRSSDRTDG